MKQRILTGWTLTRVLYLGLGTAVIINAVMIQQWFGVLFGGYFAAMGLFAFGCAAGNCFGGSCKVEPAEKKSAAIEEVDFEEVK